MKTGAEVGDDRRAGVLVVEEVCACGSDVACVAGLVLADADLAFASPLDSEEAVAVLGGAGMEDVSGAVGVTAGALNRCPACGSAADRFVLADAVEELQAEVDDLAPLCSLWLVVDADELARTVAERFA